VTEKVDGDVMLLLFFEHGRRRFGGDKLEQTEQQDEQQRTKKTHITAQQSDMSGIMYECMNMDMH
jgi:hypothetical protein